MCSGSSRNTESSISDEGGSSSNPTPTFPGCSFGRAIMGLVVAATATGCGRGMSGMGSGGSLDSGGRFRGKSWLMVRDARCCLDAAVPALVVVVELARLMNPGVDEISESVFSLDCRRWACKPIPRRSLTGPSSPSIC